jgi:hypothetical protein
MELRRKPGVPCAIDRNLLRSYTTEVALLITALRSSFPVLELQTIGACDKVVPLKQDGYYN